MSVTIQAAKKSFGGAPAIDGVDAEIGPGEFFVVLGPSGCGKSTLLRLIAGLETLDEGHIALGDRPVSGPGLHVAPEDRKVGVVFQSYALWPHMSVLDNVAFPAEAQGASRRAAREAARRQLETVDLAAHADRHPAALSGGQRQRVALARCLAGGAETVLMDEPLANLDPHLRNRMEEELADFHARSGVTTIYITHDQREAMALATRVAVMGQGRFLQVASPQELHDRPISEEVARFIGRAAVLDALAEGDSVRIGPFTVPALPNPGDASPAAPGPGRVVVRPGDVRLGGGMPARLSSAFYRGGQWEGLAEVAGLTEPLPVTSDRPIRAGEALEVALRGAWLLP
ncbi:ABC transporter ATP-binding protein [Acidimangrovimonas pyrenivorans]|uniref:ABC transporter ATP-binding protein n=1 Tax=Acidimangrovimonas pyrenivorans TaxID=2030798 RepID=A0ABV7AGV4_9RHOB